MSLDEALTKTKAQVEADNKSFHAPAFPARVNSMGYAQGLTKLEYIVTQLVASNNYTQYEAFETAKAIISACEQGTK